MNREYEVHLCLNKGNEMLTKLTSKQDISALQNKLDNIKQLWEKLKKTAVDRYYAKILIGDKYYTFFNYNTSCLL